MVNGNITWDVPSGFDFTISGNELTIYNGPLTPDAFFPITATLTSGVGNPATAVAFYNTYSCNGGTTTQMNKSGIILEKALGSTNLIYPNPAKNYINLRLNNSAKIKISDFSGRILLEQMYNPGLNRINIERFSSGIYILQITEKNKFNTHKIKINR